jgi:hypothetical protein
MNSYVKEKIESIKKSTHTNDGMFMREEKTWNINMNTNLQIQKKNRRND